MERMKRAISMLLAVVMLITMCPISAFATSEEDVGQGYDASVELETEPTESDSAEQPESNPIEQIPSEDDPASGEVVDGDNATTGSEPIPTDNPTTSTDEQQDTIYNYLDYRYTVLSDGTISICGYTGTPDSDKEGTYLEIPSSIDGVAVTQIAEEAFAYNDVIDTVLIPEGITSVGNSAFYHCSDLKAIAFCGNAPAFGFTVAEGSHALEKVFALESSDISMFCSLLVNDLGEDGAKGVEVAEYESLDALKSAYTEYINSLDAQLQGAATVEETAAPTTEETTLPTETEVEETDPAEEETESTEESTEATDESEPETESTEGNPVSDETEGSGATPELAETGTVSETTVANETEATVNNNQGVAIISDDETTGESTTTVDVIAEGACGDSLTWVLDANGVLTISGTGAMTSYSSGTAPWYSYKDSIASLILNDGITSIGSYAFANCSSMTGDLTIPDSVTSIGTYAFYGCSGFNGAITLSESLTSIGSYAFSGCTNITGTLILPDSLTSLNQYAFNNCKNLTSLEFGENFSSHGYYTFQSCSGLTEVTFHNLTVASIGSTAYSPFIAASKLQTVYVPTGSYTAYADAYKSYIPSSARMKSIGATEDFQVDDGVLTAYFGSGGEVVIPESVTAIGTSAFQNCTTVTSVTIPETVTSIGDYAFYGCTGLTAVNIPSAVTSIGSYAFYNCKGLGGTLTLPSGLTSIPAYAFYYCSSLTGDIIIPDSVTSIGTYAFYGCSGFNGTITLSESLTSIGSYAFSGCTNITGTLILPDSLTSLNQYAFNNCKNLTSLEFGENFSSHGYYTFQSCSGLTEVTFHNLTVASIGSTAYSPFIAASKLETVYVPAGSYTAYADAYKSYIPSSARMKSIGATEDFQVDDGVLTAYFGAGGEVVIPADVTAIGTSAFQNCTTVTSVTIPETVTSIGDYAFYGCTGLTAVNIPSAVTSIGSYAFYNCKSLGGTLTLPSGLTSIPAYAFYYCSSLTGDIIIPDNVTSIGTYAFYRCSGFDGTISLPEKLTSIGQYAFSSCSNITGALVLPDALTSLNTGAFSYCSKITSVEFGENFKTHGYDAFDGCSSVTEVTFNNLTVAAISNNRYSPFYTMSKLETVYVPAGSYAAYADAYKTYIPNTARMKSIGATEDFQVDDGVLTAYFGNGGEVVIPAGVTAIGTSAFQNCTTVTSVTIPETVTSIGDYAFYGCTGLTAVNIPSAVTSIGSYAFYNCKSLGGTLILPSGLTSVPAYAFYYCSSLTGDIIIPDNVTSIGTYAFYRCSGFDGTITLSESLTSIGQYAFSGCTNITGALILPDALTSLSSSTFYDCEKITSVEFGENFKTHGYDAFDGCSSVTEVTFNNLTVAAIGNNRYSPFYTMSKLETVYVPADSYDAYVSAYSSYVSGSVVFSTDFINAKVTNFKAEKIYSQSVVLSWNAHTSEQVVGYTISRDGEVVGTTTECDFTDRNLIEGTKYTYFVQGYTEDGETTPIAEITVTPAGPNILDIKTDNSLNKVDDDHGTIYIHVSNGKNLQPLGDEENVGKLYYISGENQILIGEAELNTTLGSSSTAVYTVNWDISVLEDGEYELLFVLTDIDGASDEYSETVTIDRSVPAQIVGVTAIGDVQVIYLTWAISSEADTNIYRIYRRAESDEVFRLVAQINDRSTLTYTDSNVKTDRIYYYYVVGVNEFGAEGEASEIAGATLSADTEAPTVTKLTPVNASYLTGTVKFTLTAEDNVSATSAALYYSVDDSETWALMAEMSAGNFSTSFDTTTLTDGVIHVKGVAYDAAGNESSALTYVYYVDNTGPEQVQGLAYESTNVTVTLSWSDVSDEDIRYYRVEHKNSDGSYSTVSDVYSTLGVNIYNLTPETEYTYRVVGYDTQGNRGTPSDDITATTLGDTTAPVITKIRPTSGYYSTSISLSMTATDEYNVAQIVVQASTDAINWNDIYTQTYTGISKSRTLSYELPLAGYSEGTVYVRAIATDTAGNESESGVNAPYVQHIVDRTAPAAPDGVEATGNSGYIEVSWVQGSETDLNKYAVYRSEAEDGTYVLLKDSIAATNYIDRNVEEGIVYYYKVIVDDVAGNVSEYSSIVSAEVIKDTEDPEIYSVYPEAESKLGVGFKTVSVLAIDNNCLDTVLVEYSADGENYHTLLETTGIDDYNATLSADIPVAEFADGDTVYVRFSAIDASGNTCEHLVYEYTIDAAAPSVKTANAEFVDGDVYITWTGNMEDDLSVYRIYRKTGLTGSYSLFAQRQAVNGQEGYYCYDGDLSDEEITYYYKIEAVDKCGNGSSIATNAVVLPDRSMPTPVISCETTQEIGVEYIIDASLSEDNTGIVSYLFDFGDGTTSTAIKPVHVYEETGEYTITLTVTDDDGNTSTTTKVISVKDRSLIGTVKIQIVDENGVAVAGAPVYFDLGEENQVVKYTDSSGYASFTTDVGKHTIGCIIANNEWLPVKKDIIVVAGAETAVTMTMVHHVLIEGQFEITRMTFEEIVAAGIDVSQPENQYIVKVNVTLTYSDEVVDLSFNYNVLTGTSSGGGNFGGLGGSSGGGGGGNRNYVPVVLNTGNDISEATIAVLDMPVEASFLREFFDVKLHILNNASSDFSMTGNVITLNVPEGLTIVDTNGTEGDSVVKIEEIVGQSTETINWIVRGDEEGEYYLTADYTGTLSEFNEQISTEFIAEDPIKVYGMSAVKLIAEVNSTVNYDAFYFNLSIENVSDIDVYMPSIGVTGDILTTYLQTITAESEDGEETEEIEYSAPDIRHLNTVLSNSSGFSQTIGTSTTVTALSPGETLTNKYAVYNVVGYNNIMYLKNAVYEMAEEYGIQFEIIETDMDLFSMDNAAEKLAEIKNTPTKHIDYINVLDHSEYFYVAESLNRDTSFWTMEGEALYGAMKAMLNLDFNYNKEETMELTREFVSQLLIDESMQQAIDANIDTKFLDVTKKTLNAISGIVSDNTDTIGFGESDLKIFSEIISDSNNIRKLSVEMQENGLDGVMERLSEICVSTGISVALNTDFLTQEVDSSGILGEAFSSACGKITGVIDHLDTVFTAWNTSAELTKQLVTIAAAEEEAVALLNMLIEYVDVDSAIYTELVIIRNSINKVSTEMATQFITRLTASVIQSAAGDEVKAILEYVDFTYGTSFGVIYTIAKLTFGTLDYVFDWSGTIEDLHVLRVCTEFSLALRKAVEKYGLEAETNEQAMETMRALKYLIKIRMLGEQGFANCYDQDSDKQKENLDWVNSEKGTSYASLDEYVSDVLERLQTYRDNLFATYYTNLDIPEAPTVTINYLTSTTNETFSSSYEYSFEGSVWNDCTGTTITFEPGNISKRLWVRVKETSTSVSGNITKIVIPAMPRITGDISVIYTGSSYQISGLTEGTYQYAFTNEKSAETLSKTFTVAEGETVTIQESVDWTYLAIRTPATETSFESQIRYLVTEEPEKDWVINTEKKVVTGMPESTTVDEVVEYYTSQGYSVSITNVDGEATDVVGTGCTLNLDGEAYAIVVLGDVNGDAAIDIFDLYIMLDYINSATTLTGVYLDAGCVCQNEDIDIFDFYSELEYINSGSFSE